MCDHTVDITSDLVLTYDRFRYVERGLKIGFNCEPRRSLWDTLNQPGVDQCYTTQFFLGSSQSYKRTLPSRDDIFRTRYFCDRYDFQLVTHAPFVINLATTDPVKQGRGTAAIQTELDTLAPVRAHTVLHTGTGDSVTDVVNTLRMIRIPAGNRYPLLLENSAGENRKLGRNFAEIAAILDAADAEAPGRDSNIGFCLDTCHIFAAGEYNLSFPFEVDRMFADVAATVGIGRLRVIHLNDSKAPFGSCRDLHENLGRGYIWGANARGLVRLMELAKEFDINVILETGDRTCGGTVASDLDILQHLAKEYL